MGQKVIFGVVPSRDPDAVIGHARYVVNADSGIGMDVLRQIIAQHIPSVDHLKVCTTKEIVRTDRYECPCCHTDLSALVRVCCEGLVMEEWEKVSGLYKVGIYPDHGNCKVIIEKLSGTKIFEGRCDYLPSKDYHTDPVARKEIEDRYAAIAELAAKNPGKVMSVSGIETSEDLSNLVKNTVNKFTKS